LTKADQEKKGGGGGLAKIERKNVKLKKTEGRGKRKKDAKQKPQSAKTRVLGGWHWSKQGGENNREAVSGVKTKKRGKNNITSEMGKKK